MLFSVLFRFYLFLQCVSQLPASVSCVCAKQSRYISKAFCSGSSYASISSPSSSRHPRAIPLVIMVAYSAYIAVRAGADPICFASGPPLPLGMHASPKSNLGRLTVIFQVFYHYKHSTIIIL